MKEKYLEYPNIDFKNRYIIKDNGDIVSTFNNKIMKHAFNKDSYKRVVLTDETHKKHLLYVHRIVAYNFIPNPLNLPMINHKDENPSNNRVSNLEWCDVTYNNTYNDLHKRKGEKLRGERTLE